MKNENFKHCEAIVNTMISWYNGDVRSCPECGEQIERDDWDDIGDKFKCPHCGEVVNTEHLDVLSLWSFFEDDVYDIAYTVGSNKEYRSVRLMVACGGPNIFIDTKTGRVELYWWNEKADAYIPTYIVEEIDFIWEEYFNCL